MNDRSDDTFARVVSVTRSVFRLEASTPVRSETTSADIDGWDSLSHSRLIMNVEEEFGVELPLEAAFELADVGELVELVRVARGRKRPS